MKSLFLVLMMLCAVSFVHAQQHSTITLKGTVSDTTGETMPFATVMLLNAKDSSLLLFKQSNDAGAFEFSNLKNNPYILKVFFTGYIPVFKQLVPSAAPVNDLGTIKLKPITKALMEVVVKTAKATLTMKGDTMEYNAAAFKVPPGSTVEDLLRRLPGIEVDGDGNIQAQGKDVKRVYVDGKTFFGDDPKAATKNLDANTISKVQVFNDKSEQARLTGVDDGKKEKAMNLQLKDEFKKGAFGKITAAAGTEERWASRGNYNRFNKKEQFSVIGYANNINETGVNWDDYSEFKGQNTFQGRETGDFGFQGNAGRFWNISDNILNNFDGRGFTKNAGLGTNYNYDNKKTKFNTNYFYNQTRLDLDQYSERQNFLSNGTFKNTDTLGRNEFRNNHSVATRIEQMVDSANTVIVKASAQFSQSNTDETQHQLFLNQASLRNNELNISNDNKLKSYSVNGLAIYRHKFKKKGRTFAVSGNYNLNQSDATENILSLNQFFEANNPTDQIRYINRNLNNRAAQQLKSSVLFVEPLSKKFFLETFYNTAYKTNDVTRPVTNPDFQNQRIDSLSVYFENTITYNRIGSTLRYAYEGINISTGLAAQQLSLKNSYAIAKNTSWLEAPLVKTYTNLTPYIETSLELTDKFSIDFDYKYNINEPQISDLQPIPNVNNLAYKVEGNPNLTPERSHQLSTSANYWNSGNSSNFGVSLEYRHFDNRIVYNQRIQNVENIGLQTITRPINVSGGDNGEGYVWFGFPIIKSKLTFRGNANTTYDQQPSFVNDIQNDTRSLKYNLSGGLNFIPLSRLIVGLNARYSRNDIKYSISPNQNQIILNNSLTANMKWNVYKKIFFESNFSYTSYENAKFGFDQKLPIWNASLRQLLTKSNKVEIRLAIFDIFNKKVNIVQNATQNYVLRSIAPTLARYAMLSISYNVRGYEDKLKKNNWW